MLWIGLYFPRLALDTFPATTTPLAIVDARAILQGNDAALEAGVRPGQKRSTALALAPGLLLRERDARREADALRGLGGWLLQFTPSVSLEPPEAIVLEVAASLRLFGGREALLARIRTGLGAQGFSVQAATALTASAALLLARHRDGLAADRPDQLQLHLARLPIAILATARPRLDALERLGVRSLRDLRQLPRAGLARRLGADLLAEVDRAFGQLAEARAWFVAAPVFCARLELPSAVENAQALIFATRRLLMQLSGWLAARHAAVRGFTVRGEHDSAPPTVLELQLADASRDTERLALLLRERLETVRLPEPVHTLHLESAAIVEAPLSSDSLFPMAASGAHESLARLVERLQARLGRSQIQRLSVVEDHRPETTCRVETIETLPTGTLPTGTLPTGTLPAGTAGAAASPVTAPSTVSAHPCVPCLPRPLWLLRRPIVLEERNNRPWFNGPLRLLAGPERIEVGWWDDHLVQRDYFIAESAEDAMLWIFRTRAAAMSATGGWFLHGRFG